MFIFFFNFHMCKYVITFLLGIIYLLNALQAGDLSR